MPGLITIAYKLIVFMFKSLADIAKTEIVISGRILPNEVKSEKIIVRYVIIPLNVNTPHQIKMV
jgi:hypothetical protein